MDTVTIEDLPVVEELDTEEMAAVHGGQRIFRITNTRINATSLSGGAASGSIPVQASLESPASLTSATPIGALDDAGAQP
jgi:hypothetical protein